jgi:hypothetical protein
VFQKALDTEKRESLLPGSPGLNGITSPSTTNASTTTKIRIIKRYTKFCGGNLYDNLDY